MSARKGARSLADISPEILRQLNSGELESASLSEGLAIRFHVLLRSSVEGLPDEILEQVEEAQSEGVTRRMALVGRLLYQELGPLGYPRLLRHPSDTVRGWAAYLLASAEELTLGERLILIRPLADDPHFGVREWAWMALRPRLAEQLESALFILQDWVRSDRPNLRRFAIEITRPRGVWCAALPPLQQNPARALHLLEPLRRDPSRYVQNSVANWLNDAAKSKPEWVKSLCVGWRNQESHPATDYICRRALRSFEASTKKKE